MLDLRSRRAGFTLIELMLVVAIIGTICAIAIPSFIRYQLRARRSEAYANLSGVAKSSTSYFAANGVFYATGVPQPGGLPTTTKRLWDAPADTAFATLGFRPEGNVYYSYDVNTAGPGGSCASPTAFTATAYGDVDGNGLTSLLMYVHPDATGAVCGSGILGFGTPIENGVPVTNQVSWNRLADPF